MSLISETTLVTLTTTNFCDTLDYWHSGNQGIQVSTSYDYDGELYHPIYHPGTMSLNSVIFIGTLAWLHGTTGLPAGGRETSQRVPDSGSLETGTLPFLPAHHTQHGYWMSLPY